MANQIEEIAARIRALREIAGLSIESLAREFEMDPEEYSGWEKGSSDIPVGALYRIAGRFKVDLAELITGKAPHLHSYCLTRAGRGPSVQRRSPYGYKSLAYNFINKKAEPFLVEVGAESEKGPLELNTHPGQEFDYVVEGRLLISIGGHELTLEAGDCVYFDSNEPHGMKALGSTPARFIAVIL